ncbi:hypothetical protein F383_36155 [Gossypium arboreum]|uniref:Uncharacterized protein n=1 Tax=Gossypium arboreum TaxID=29729 RepID=A0A0B0PYR5_GOSAR|nr:hypothetical protein F383_36155 [Gossypium arboreum]
MVVSPWLLGCLPDIEVFFLLRLGRRCQACGDGVGRSMGRGSRYGGDQK